MQLAMWNIRAGRRVFECSNFSAPLARWRTSVAESPVYNPLEVEGRWAGKWAWPHSTGTKFYMLSMFPYPSGRLHMGHVRVYTISDTLARYHRMRDEEVLHPMGWDAFGLPAENAAIDRGVDPLSWTQRNIEEMRRQLDRMGCHFNWEREVTTCSPNYYRWTQWLFLQLYNKGLAYKKKAVVNWDPVDQTVLANEQVDSEGRSWRSGAIVQPRLLEQWFFKITHYADALLEGLSDLDWPDNVKNTQRQWIGRSNGACFDFQLSNGESLRAFTTSQHTLYGVTFLAISPHHPLVESLSVSVQTAVADIGTHTSSGVFSGLYATHPLTAHTLPVFVADYVISDYGTQAVMGVPAHDQRDSVFAREHHLSVVEVVEDGRLINSEQFSGLSLDDGATAITEHAQIMGVGGHMTTYKLRDWLISRQRYWGAPIPIIYCDQCGTVPVPEEDLPVLLPSNVAFTGRGPSPLATDEEWGRVSCPNCSRESCRDTDTMDTFVDSAWYFLRFASSQSDKLAFTQEVNDWMPVNIYVGGIEHAHLHLLYARFITHVLADIGLLATKEPFQKLIAQGMVTGLTYQDRESGRYLQPDEVKGHSDVVTSWEKMSKSKHNGVDPKEVIGRYGADAVRLFMLFKAPPELGVQWEERAILGVHRWLHRLWKLAHSHITAAKVGGASSEEHSNQIVSATHKAIKHVTEAMNGRYTLNTALPELMTLSNILRDTAPSAHTPSYHEALCTLTSLLAPMAPHISAELWHGLSTARQYYHNLPPLKGSVFQCGWPQWKDELLSLSQTRSVVLQINGLKKTVLELSVATIENSEELKKCVVDCALESGLISSSSYRVIVANKGLLVNIVTSSLNK